MALPAAVRPQRAAQRCAALTRTALTATARSACRSRVGLVRRPAAERAGAARRDLPPLGQGAHAECVVARCHGRTATLEPGAVRGAGLRPRSRGCARAGKAALDALLERVASPADAKLATAAVERCGSCGRATAGAPRRHAHACSHAPRAARASFHKQRCAAGWLTGLGGRTSSLYAQACSRTGTAELGVTAFARANTMGLSLTPDISRRVLAAAAQQARAARAARGRATRARARVAAQRSA